MRTKDTIDWKLSAGATAHVTFNRRTLAVTILQGGDGTYAVLAVETDADVKGSTARQAIDKVLGAHAHENVGVYRSLTDAMVDGSEYMKAWMKRKKGAEKCDCGPVGRPARRPKKK